MTNDQLLHKWINKTITAEELEVFQQRPEYESLTALYRETEGLTIPDVDSDKMLESILATPKTTADTAGPVKTRKLIPRWIKYGIAASVALLAGVFSGVFPSPFSQMVTYELAEGQTKEGVLPDDSTFSLEGNSSLSYDEKKWSDSRTVSLRGEAFFQVEQGSKFTVETPIGHVEVLGTEFNVITKSNLLVVGCKEGKVLVTSEHSDDYKEELVAGESAFVQQGGLSKTFKSNVTKLRKVSLGEVKDQLSSKYDLKWITDGVDMMTTLTCNFQHDNLDMALKTCLDPLNIRYELLNGNTVKLIN